MCCRSGTTAKPRCSFGWWEGGTYLHTMYIHMFIYIYIYTYVYIHTYNILYSPYFKYSKMIPKRLGKKAFQIQCFFILYMSVYILYSIVGICCYHDQGSGITLPTKRTNNVSHWMINDPFFEPGNDTVAGKKKGSSSISPFNELCRTFVHQH